MMLKTIETEQEYDDIMAWVDEQFDRKLPANTPEGEVLQVALLLIKAYEDEHHTIPATVVLV